MKHKMLLLTLAAMLFGWCGAIADLPDDTLWTKNVHPDYLVAADFSPDETKVLAAAHGGLFVYEAETGNLIKLWREPYLNYGVMHKVIFSKNESLMFARYDTIAIMWNWEKEELLWFTTKKDEKSHLHGSFLWDQDYDNLIFISTDFVIDPEIPNTDKKIKFYDGKTGELLNVIPKTITGYIGEPSAISNNGRYLAYSWGISNWPYPDKEYYLVICDLQTGEDYSIRFNSSSSLPETIAFSPDNNNLATGGDDGIVRIFDMNQDEDTYYGKTKKMVKKIEFEKRIRCMSFSKDGNYLLVSQNGGSIRTTLYNAINWEQKFSYPYVLGTSNFDSKGNIIATNIYSIRCLREIIYSSIQYPEDATILYPNPTSKIVNIEFENKHTSNVNISIYNESGVLIDNIISQTMETGEQTISYDCTNLPIGTYFFVIKTGNNSRIAKFVVVR